jgi:adenine deaminase
MKKKSVQGNIVNIKSNKINWGAVNIINDKIDSIELIGDEQINKPYIIPGFIDSHVHIESSMLVPSEFARLAVVHGTIGTISDPHEIANVCGMEGVKYMIENSKTVPFKCTFGAPSCVPATIFETAGASINADEVDELLKMPEIKYLSEMMNFPGVLNQDSEVLKKIESAKKHKKPVDGHAPGLRGADAKKYIDAGITTDHECFTAEEALDKLNFGMKILIREGSAAKNFEALINLMHEHSDMMMFCSDDKHPDSLADGHINQLCARAVKKGIDKFKVLKAACINPVEHYKMDVGTLKINDWADFVVVNNLIDFDVRQTYINGLLVAENGCSFIDPKPASIINQFNCSKKLINDFDLPYENQKTINVIEALDGQLITNKITSTPKVIDGKIVSDVDNDILKIVVVNRYSNQPIAKSFIKNMGIKKGALASSVAHDSHNIVAVGVDDQSICEAVNLIIKSGGGVSAVSENDKIVLSLPVAGLMSNLNGYDVAKAYTEIDLFSKNVLGSRLSAPFMTLSFMALLVIPHLKLSDKGLFDGNQFKFI